MMSEDQIRFVSDPRGRMVSESELCDLLERAEEMGFSLGKGSELEHCTINDIERLVRYKV